jgi:hypothetical protein
MTAQEVQDKQRFNDANPKDQLDAFLVLVN